MNRFPLYVAFLKALLRLSRSMSDALARKLEGIESVSKSAVPKLESEAILVPIEGLQSLKLKALSGKRNIAGSKDVFSYVDSDFTDWNLDVPCKGTEDSAVSVFEQAKDATFAQMFDYFGRPLKSLTLTQGQIVEFCIAHKEHLRKGGYGTLFLFEENKEFFVANVFFNVGGSLRVCAHRLVGDHVWGASNRHRIVVPATAKN